MRLMMIWHDLSQRGESEFLYKGRKLTSQEKDFWIKYFSYWRNLKIDILKAWTAEELKYFNQNVDWDIKSMPVQNNLRPIFDDLMETLSHSPYANKLGKYFLESFSGNRELVYAEFMHWLNVIYTRNHVISQDKWIEMKETNFKGGDSSSHEQYNDEEQSMQQNVLLSRELWGERVNLLIPMLDLPNHHTPLLEDQSDYFKFTLEINVRNIGDQNRQKSYLVLQTNGLYPALGQEVAYSYNPHADNAIKLLMSYGYVTSHENVHNKVPLVVNLGDHELLQEINTICKEKAEAIGVKQESIQASTDDQDSYFLIHKPQQSHDSGVQGCLRIKDASKGLYRFQLKHGDGGIRGSLNGEMLAFGQALAQADDIIERDQIGLWGALSYFQFIKESFGSASIAQDLKVIQEQRKIDGQFSRRKVLTHQIAIQQKQVKQLHQVRALRLATYELMELLYQSLRVTEPEKVLQKRDFIK